LSLAAIRLAIAVRADRQCRPHGAEEITKRTRTDVEIVASDAGAMMDVPRISKLQRNRLSRSIRTIVRSRRAGIFGKPVRTGNAWFRAIQFFIKEQE